MYRGLFIPIDALDDRGLSCSADRASSGNTETVTAEAVVCAYKLDVEQIRREILSGGRGRRARSEQGPHPRDVQQQQHLWPGVDRPQPVGRQTNMTTQASGSARGWPWCSEHVGRGRSHR